MRTRLFCISVVLLGALAGCSDDDLGGSPLPTAPPSSTRTATVAATSTSVPQPSATTTLVATLPATPTPTNQLAPTETATAVLPTPTATSGAGNASARRITSESELLGGPLAHGRIGDWLLENDVARFIIQDAPRRDLYSVGQFGGNIIDAELRSRPGQDNFLEVQPAVNIETVINVQSIEIVNDGTDGEAAILRACGPDDILDFVNPSTIVEGAGLPFPDSADDVDDAVEGCTDYVLEPGKPFVKMVTTIFNEEDAPLGLYVGDYINGCGELDQWTSTEAGLGEILTGNYGVLSYIGIGEATGVDYSVVPVPVEGSAIAGSSFFTASGVSYLMQSHSILNVIFGAPPTFIVPAGGSRSYTRYFGVGDGSGSNAIDIQNEVRDVANGTLRGCVTVGGEPAPGARVAVGVPVGGIIPTITSIFSTGADGCYHGTLPVGAYAVTGSRAGALYEGGGTLPLQHDVTIAAGSEAVQDIALPPTGRVSVLVRDANGVPLPARIAVIGFDPSPETVLPTQPIPGLGQISTGLFNDITKDALLFGYVAMEYAGPDGAAAFDVEPGTYQLYVMRGTEYSLFTQPITVTAGQLLSLEARIAPVLDTAGFISSDYHVHGINSADARVSHRNRVYQFAGEGVDNLIMTDHHVHTDLTPVIQDLGFADFLHTTIGEEITTWDYGHFNAYPMLVDPSRPSKGSTDWGRAAPAGEDFPSLGNYSMTPAELAALATEGPQSTDDTVIQINHIDSFFTPLEIDTALVPPRSFLTNPGKVRFRLDPATENLFHHFQALELWNGAGRSAQRAFLVERIGVWMNHLNQGLRTTAISDTDTHEFTNLNTAGARTWTASPTDEPNAIDSRQVGRAVADGKAVGGQGIYVQARLAAADDSGGVADLTLGGSTLVASTAGVDLEIVVQAPLWAPYDRIEIYANADTVVAARGAGGLPTLYGAEPTRVLNTGQDFSVETVEVAATVAGASRLESRLTVPFHELAQDTWFVVVVRGTDGVSRPMFPVFAHDLTRAPNLTLADLLDGNLGQGGVMALGYTNALYADVDGTPGFDPPRTAPQ